MRHHGEIGPAGCDIHTDVVTQGILDLVQNDGQCNASDLAGFASLIGTACGVASQGGPKYNPVADYNKDGEIDGVDTALFVAHFGHHCSQWQPMQPSKPSMADYPWEVLDRPDVKAAIAKAGVDRQFVVDIWLQNGPNQQLFAPAGAYDLETHWAERQAENKPTVFRSSWGTVKRLFR